MSNPASENVHLDAALSDLSIGWAAQNYKWDRIFPVVPVDKQSDKYHIYDNDDFRRDAGEEARRAPTHLANRSGYDLSSDSYYCDDWAWGKSTADEDISNQDDSLDLEGTATRFVTEVINRRLERQLISEMLTTSVWGVDVTGAAATDYSAGTDEVLYWGTTATSAPIEDVAEYCDRIQIKTGLRPNALVLARDLVTVLKNHPDFIGRLPANDLGVIGNSRMEAQLAMLFDVDEVIILDSSYNSAAPGATVSNAWNFTADALLFYKPSSPGKGIPAAGYSFRWGNRAVLRYADTPPGKMAQVVELHDYVDFKVTMAAAGVFFNNILSA